MPRGFTIVELVVVIILLAILSAVALSRSISTSAFAPATIAHQMQQELKLAQAIAMSRQDTQVFFALTRDGDNWQMRTTSTANGTLRDVPVPAEQTDIRVTSGITTTTLADGDTLLTQFSSRGDLATLSIVGTPAPPATGLLVEVVGDSTRTLCLYNSGYLANGIC